MKTLHYKGFWIQSNCGYGRNCGIGHHPYPETMFVRDGNNDEYLDGRRNVMVSRPFYFSTLLTIKQAIDRYHRLRPDDPIFHGRWRNSPEMEAIDTMEVDVVVDLRSLGGPPRALTDQRPT